MTCQRPPGRSAVAAGLPPPAELTAKPMHLTASWKALKYFPNCFFLFFFFFFYKGGGGDGWVPFGLFLGSSLSPLQQLLGWEELSVG